MSLLGAADPLTEFTSQKLTKSLLAQRAMQKKVTLMRKTNSPATKPLPK
jgi:hypothetical protein